jgi:hypothetical protein
MFLPTMISACMNAPGMSTVATSRFAIASIVQVNNTDSIDTVGALETSFNVKACYLRQSAHTLHFIFPVCFCLRNIR